MERIENVCYYCGMPASTTDHVIPQVILKAINIITNPEMYDKIRSQRILTVPACTECNCLLNASYQNTLENRKKYLKQKLKKRYKKFLKTPDWEEEELNEIGNTLRSHIKASLIKRDLIRRRIAW